MDVTLAARSPPFALGFQLILAYSNRIFSNCSMTLHCRARRPIGMYSPTLHAADLLPPAPHYQMGSCGQHPVLQPWLQAWPWVPAVPHEAFSPPEVADSMAQVRCSIVGVQVSGVWVQATFVGLCNIPNCTLPLSRAFCVLELSASAKGFHTPALL